MADKLSQSNPDKCPGCGATNFAGAHFCRACGGSLVTENMIEQRTPEPSSLSEPSTPFLSSSRRTSKPSIERGIKTSFTGLLFLTMALITLFVLPGSGTAWWFWMLILAAFFGLSAGVTEIVRHVVDSRQHPQIGRSVSTPATLTPTRVERELSAADR